MFNVQNLIPPQLYFSGWYIGDHDFISKSAPNKFKVGCGLLSKTRTDLDEKMITQLSLYEPDIDYLNVTAQQQPKPLQQTTKTKDGLRQNNC